MLAKIAMILGSLVLSLLAAEALVGFIDPQVSRRPRVWQFDEQLGWAHVPSSGGTFVAPEFEVDIRINAEGLRDRDYERAKAPGTRRLLAFGDSFIEGWGVEVEESVSKRLEARLQEKAGGPIEVINFGVAGYGTDQELLFFEKTGRHYGPDRVLVFFYGNDLWNNALPNGIGSERGYKPVFRPGPGGRLQLNGVPVRKHPFWDRHKRELPWDARLQRYLGDHWHLYLLARKALSEPPARTTHGEFYGAIYGPASEPRWERLWDLSGRILAAFDERVKSAGAELTVVYIPAIVQIEAEDWRMKREMYDLVGDFDLQMPNRRLRYLADVHGFDLVDLYDPFVAAAAEGTLYFRDSHWNPAGHDLAAAVLADSLAARGL